MNWLKWFYEFMYRFRQPPWDTGITPPEVVSVVGNGEAKRGRALDLGCGTGTNSIYLAQHGFQVVGVDFAPKAIAVARAQARRAGVDVKFHIADVTQIDFLDGKFDLVLDIGCFHGIPHPSRSRYVQHVARLTNPGSLFLIYAFSPRSADEPPRLVRFRNVGATPTEIQDAFKGSFELTRIEHGTNRGERPSAWYWFRRQ